MSTLSLFIKGYTLWIVLPLAVLLALAIARLYRRETEGLLKNGVRLRTLRAAAVLLMALLLAQPVVNSISVEHEKPVVIVLRDISTSMSVKDNHDPLERRVRTAVALGLLDKKLRDTNAEEASRAFGLAQTSSDSAAANVRQAAQVLAENSANAATARERVKAAVTALNTAETELQRGAKLVKAVPASPPPLAQGAEAQAAAIAKLAKEISEVEVEKAEGQARLTEKSKAAGALAPELARLSADAAQLQNTADRTLGQSADPVVKAALEKLSTLDRAAITSGMIDARTVAEVGDRVRLVQYGIDTDLRDLVPAAKDGVAAPAAPTDTDLATPLIHIAERHAQDSIAAVVICSDGRHTSGPIPEDAARLLSARGITVHTLGVGSETAPPDICVARLEGTQSVFMEETIKLTAHVKVAGLKGQKCVLVLSREDKMVQQRELSLGDDGWLHESFEIPADKPGPNVFTASIKPLPGEVLTMNNSAEFIVDVANDRLKVLLADELPRWESRYVASLLRRERKMTLDERWLLSGENLGPKPKALPLDEKALEDYEIIVLGDIPAERLTEEDQKRLAAYVADRGGFLVVLAGPRSMPQAYLTGPIADLLPIRQQAPASMASALSSSAASERVRVRLDEAGSTHEITRILHDPTLNEKLWTALPELHWVARPAYAKPLATTLLTTDDARRDVVVAVQNFGAGRVMYVGTDGTWNWRYKVADRVHAFFWSQAMRWGTSNRLTGGPRLKVGCARRQIRPGENIEVLARPRDAQGHIVSEAVVTADLGDTEHPQRVQLQAVPDSGGLYRGYLQNVGAGVHNIMVKVDAAGFDGIQQDVQVIAREIAGQEGIELSRDSARLAAMAKAGGGRYADILDAPELFTQLAGQGKERAHEYSFEVWSSYPVLILIVALLVIEWVLRKRLGLS